MVFMVVFAFASRSLCAFCRRTDSGNVYLYPFVSIFVQSAGYEAVSHSLAAIELEYFPGGHQHLRVYQCFSPICSSRRGFC